jgi:hypothetical protein
MVRRDMVSFGLFTACKVRPRTQEMAILWPSISKLESLQLMMPLFVCVARGRSQTAVGLVFGTLYVNAVDEEWRNVVGLLFLVASTLIFLSSVPLNIVFSLEWPNVAREYLSGANAMGPYLVSKFIYMQPFLLGDVIMASIVFFMAGTHVASLGMMVVVQPSLPVHCHASHNRFLEACGHTGLPKSA